MARIENLEELEIWKEAGELCSIVRKLTREKEFSRDFRFCSQINSAAGSIMDNIAEGFERDGNKEFINFLYMSKGSCGEVRSQNYRTLDCGFISELEFTDVQARTEKLKRKIHNLILTLKNSGSEGYK